MPTTLELGVNVKVHQREGYFAARTEPFAVTAYGKTAEEAEERAFQSVKSLLAHYDNPPQELSAYLNKRRAKHTVYEEANQTLSRQGQIIRECKRELKLEVPAGA